MRQGMDAMCRCCVTASTRCCVIALTYLCSCTLSLTPTVFVITDVRSQPQQQQPPTMNQMRMMPQPHNNSHHMSQSNHINHELYNMPPQPPLAAQNQYPPDQLQPPYMRPNQPPNGYHMPSMAPHMNMMYSRRENISELVAVPTGNHLCIYV